MTRAQRATSRAMVVASGGDGPDDKPPGPLFYLKVGADGRRGVPGESRKWRVLIVEDEVLTALNLQMHLTERGFDVCGVARSADRAVQLAERSRPDLVLMDIRLEGGGDGTDAARDLRERLGIRCLYLTAHTDPATRERADGTDHLGFLVKPFSPEQLDAALRIAMRKLVPPRS